MNSLDQLTEISDAIQQYVSDELHDKLIQAITRLAEQAYQDGQTDGFSNGYKAGQQQGMRTGADMISQINNKLLVSWNREGKMTKF